MDLGVIECVDVKRIAGAFSAKAVCSVAISTVLPSRLGITGTRDGVALTAGA